MNKFRAVFILLASVFILFSCNKQMQLTGSQLSTNSKSAVNKPYVILISLDGFRWDYVERFQPPHLSAFIQEGVQASSLIPSFPSKTFPNHYTIATGMYPDHHGLIGNNFYNYEKDASYSIRNREVVEDGTWYGGTPIWVQATKAGMVTASFFFVGSEADIQGIRPTYYYKYDGSIKNEDRVAQALAWLDMPAKERPHLLSMYFSDMDDAGHRVGPNNDKVLKEKLFALDTVLGALFDGVKATGLDVNIIIVSDHGMMEVHADNYIPVEMLEDDEKYTTVSNGATVSIHPKDSTQTEAIYQALKAKENHFKVYKTADTPQFEYTPENKNWGAIQIVPDAAYYFASQRSIGMRKASPNKITGQHGFDPNYKEMHGIFYANGSAFKKGYTTKAMKNIHVYPIMCEILGLDVPAEVDGNLEEVKDVLVTVKQ